MATKLSIMCSYFFFIVLWTLCLSGEAASFPVEVNITSNDPTDQGLPSDINVTFTTGTNTSTEFRMVRVDYDNLTIYSIETGQDGQKIKKENVSSNEDVAFYQDTKNGAVVQLSRFNADERQLDDFIITRGEYQQGNVTFFIQPTHRSKREAFQNDSQSDQRYEIKQVSSPPITMSDFLVPPPEQHSSIPTNMEGQFPFGSKLKRRRRQTFSTYYIDVTAFLDSTCYSRFLREASNNAAAAITKIREYYAFIFTEVGLIYRNFQSTRFQLRVRLTKIFIFKTASHFQLTYIKECQYCAPTSHVDAEAVLNNFSKFLNSAIGRDLVFPYDHAMLFVGADLWRSTNDVEGVAWTKTICRTDGFSASVIEDRFDYSAVIPAAHELGHSLSADHDGASIVCPASDRFLMAPSITISTIGTENHPWRFSTCTINYFSSYLTALDDTSSGRMCLSNTLEFVGDFPDVSNRILGQEISAEKQCQMRYGSSSYVCEEVTVSGIWMHPGCSGMYCYNPSTVDKCYMHVPLSGTICGCGKVCKQGLCVSSALGCVNKDIWSNCTRSKENCYKSVYSSYCQDTCANFVTNAPAPTRTTLKATPDCFDDVNFDYYGQTCQMITPTLCNYASVKIACCSTCKQWTECQDDPNFSISGLSCTSAMQSSTNHCYNTAVNASCCASCAKRYIQITGCEFGDRERDLCNGTSLCKKHSKDCCQTCWSCVASLKGMHLLVILVLSMAARAFSISRSL